jgi:hypothetical protein
VTRPSPAVTRLCATLVAELEAICAARARELIAIRMRAYMPPRRGRPRKERAL